MNHTQLKHSIHTRENVCDHIMSSNQFHLRSRKISLADSYVIKYDQNYIHHDIKIISIFDYLATKSIYKIHTIFHAKHVLN